MNIIQKLTSFYGPLVEVVIPRIKVISKKRSRDSLEDSSATDKIEKEKSRGFAFATFLCQIDAINATKGITLHDKAMRICNREVAIDFCLHKVEYSNNNKGEEVIDELKNSIDSTKDNDEDSKNHSIEDDRDDGNEENDEEDGDKDHNKDEVDNEEDSEDEHDEEDDEQEEDDVEDGDDKHESTIEKKKSNDVTELCTVFVRDLPFDADEADLRKAMYRFGKVLLAIFVKGMCNRNRCIIYQSDTMYYR